MTKIKTYVFGDCEANCFAGQLPGVFAINLTKKADLFYTLAIVFQKIHEKILRNTVK